MTRAEQILANARKRAQESQKKMTEIVNNISPKDKEAQIMENAQKFARKLMGI